MANRPLYNGSARAQVDNNPAAANLENTFNFRVSTATLGAGGVNIDNAAFEAEAGVAITLNYRIEKLGPGAEVDTPTEARIRIFIDDANNDARTGAELESADLIGGNALPRTGTVTFTPSMSGTYRIQVEMQKGNGNFGATSGDWRVISDGFFQAGGLSTIVRAVAQDKGRLRYGHKITTIDITDGGNPAPNPFAFRTDAAGTPVEKVRVVTTQSASQRRTVAPWTYTLSHRRNGASTIDASDIGTVLSGTQHRSERTVGLVSFPLTNVATTYDAVIQVATNSDLHSNNTTRVYNGLAGSAGSGVWVHFISDGTLFVDFRTAAKLASHVVNPGGSIENFFCKKSSTYSEVGGVPQGAEDFEYIATDENMTAKVGRVLNARGEVLEGVFVVGDVVHEASGTSRASWGVDSNTFKTVASGWQGSANVVTVSTPPSGVHRVKASAYSPTSSFGTPANRQFFVERIEQGAPAGVGAGKNWIAPASFMQAAVVSDQVVPVGAVPFSVHVFERGAEVDADLVPSVKVFKNRSGGAPFAEPVLTKRAGTTGIYDGTFTPSSALATPGDPDVYEIAAAVTVKSTTKTYSGVVTVVAINEPTRYRADGAGFVGFPSK